MAAAAQASRRRPVRLVVVGDRAAATRMAFVLVAVTALCVVTGMGGASAVRAPLLTSVACSS